MAAEFDPHAFYETPLGLVAARLIRRALAEAAPARAGDSVLGIGHARPFLRLWRGTAARRIAAVPGRAGDPPPAPWPRTRTLTCVIDGAALPFPDLCFDRVLLVHGLELAENAPALLRDVWRVLKDDGRVIVIAPNRTGFWAHLESTPFGHGQPYSAGQISRLLSKNLFRITAQRACLFVPPVRSRLLLRAAPALDYAGSRAAASLAGVTLTEAAKDVFGIMPIRGVARMRKILVEHAA